MGKRKNRKTKKSNNTDKPELEESQPIKKLKVDFPEHSIIKTNPFFEQYYRNILNPYFSSSADPEAEFQQFLNTLRLRLPVTFRINNNILNYQCFLEKVKNPNWISDLISKQTQEILEQTQKKPELPQGLDFESKDISHKIPLEKKEVPSEKKENKGLSEEDLLELETFKKLSFKKISWYPEDLVWELNLDKTKLKKTKLLDKVHEYLQKATDAGLITRQELVSMIPPLLLDVQSSDIIFDMCAAPGSKTAQLLEMLYSEEAEGKGMTSGGVLANDSDYVRSYMLIHQIQRICTAGMVVLNHAAQFFPTLNKPEFELNTIGKYDNRVYFDKILADVPCSGDGAMRKLPNKWSNWHTQDGMSLHTLQTQLLMRGLQLLKVDGLLLYSTCSINPIEDEAVVTEAFRRSCPGCFELIDVHQLLPGFKGRKGLKSWPVWEKKQAKNEEIKEESKETDFFRKYESYKEFLDYLQGTEFGKNAIKTSMFAENEEFMEKTVQIEKTMRVLPHDQNTGGFYIALFKKLKPIVLLKAAGVKEKTMISEEKNEKIEVNEENEMKIEESLTANPLDLMAFKLIEKLNKEEAIGEAQENTEIGPKGKKAASFQPAKKSAKILWKTLENEEYEWIREYYGISSDFPKDQLIYLVESGPKKILLISEGIRKILEYDSKQVLNKVNLGSKAFARNKEGFSKNFCRYRICQDSIGALFPFISKRKLACSLEDFKFILSKKNFRHEEVPNENLRKCLKEIPEGSFVLYMEGKKGDKMPMDILVCQNFTKTVSIMCSKELYGSFYIKYF